MSTAIIISLTLAFFVSALSQIVNDLNRGPIDKPGWALRPTLTGALIIGITWFVNPILDLYHETKQLARSIAYGLLGVLLHLAILTAFFWVAISLSIHYFHNIFFQIMFIAVLSVVGVLFILPIIHIVMVPIMLIISLPLNLLFPLNRPRNTPH